MAEPVSKHDEHNRQTGQTGQVGRTKQTGRTGRKNSLARSGRSRLNPIILYIILILFALLSFGIGRFPISPKIVVDILLSRFNTGVPYWAETLETVVMNVRLPRILLAMLVGGALSVSGASYQTLFKNPMVSPDILGVSAGAGFASSAGSEW